MGWLLPATLSSPRRLSTLVTTVISSTFGTTEAIQARRIRVAMLHLEIDLRSYLLVNSVPRRLAVLFSVAVSLIGVVAAVKAVAGYA